MGVRELLEYAGILVVSGGGGKEWCCTCPKCAANKLYVNKHNGQFRCHTGGTCWEGNAWHILRNHKKSITNTEAQKLMERFDVGSMGHPMEKTARKGKPRLGPGDLIHMTPSEIEDFCAMKQVCPHTAQKVLGRFWRHTKEPWALLPIWDPRSPDGPACGFLRAHLGSDLIETSSGPSKYPTIAGSAHSLWGVKWLLRQKYDTIYYLEGWKEVIAVAALGFVATAGSGGAGTFLEHWLTFFTTKTVYICMDADKGGVDGMEKARQMIGSVAKKVYFVMLPYEVKKKKGNDLHDLMIESQNLDGYTVRRVPKTD